MHIPRESAVVRALMTLDLHIGQREAGAADPGNVSRMSEKWRKTSAKRSRRCEGNNTHFSDFTGILTFCGELSF